jgi:uncharacterized protein (DUF2062 family)
LRCSKIAAALGTWVTNPLNFAIVFPLFFLIGKTILPFEVHSIAWQEISNLRIIDVFRLAWDWYLVTAFGGFVITLPSSVVAYHIALRLVRTYHTMRADRSAERRRKKLRHG